MTVGELYEEFKKLDYLYNERRIIKDHPMYNSATRTGINLRDRCGAIDNDVFEIRSKEL